MKQRKCTSHRGVEGDNNVTGRVMHIPWFGPWRGGRGGMVSEEWCESR